jgi:hypothetical protein
MGCGSAGESRELKTVVVLVLRISRGRVSDGPGRSRTCDLGIKSPLLYQLSYRPAGREYRRGPPGTSTS